MPGNEQQGFKTEEQLKAEAKARRAEQARIDALKPKSPVKQKRENFWYHYKWHTIIGALAVIIAAFFIKDMFFRTMPDATIVMIARDYYTAEEITELQAAIEAAATDYNGDNKVSVSIDYINLPDEGGEGGQADYASTMKLTTVIAAAIDPIYLLDDAALRHINGIAGQGGETPPEDAIFAPESVSAASLSTLSGETRARYTDLHFYLRRGEALEKKEDYYAYCKALLQAIAAGS